MDGMESPTPLAADEPPLPRLPRVSLRSMLLWLAAISVLFAIMSKIGLLWSVVLLWSLLLVAGHVLGNLWGSHAYHSQPSNQQALSQTSGPVGRQVTHPDSIRLRRHIRGGRGRAYGVAVGAILLGAAGGTFFTMVYWYAATAPGIVVWYVSCAVVGALAGFVVSGFLQACAGQANGQPALLSQVDSM